MFKRILVPLDGSELAEQALPLAVALGHQFNSHLILIRMVEFTYPSLFMPHMTSATAVSMSETYEQAKQEAHHYLLAQQKKLQADGINAQIILCEAEAAEGIIYNAKENQVDCIVMSTHGRSGLARWTLGSVADKVARHAPCPVLLARQHNAFDQENLTTHHSISIKEDNYVS
ncbi:MAG: universal stress protein [Anaerolineae bacterium]|nr:universal stress protein [Anaerolineae bacterium]